MISLVKMMGDCVAIEHGFDLWLGGPSGYSIYRTPALDEDHGRQTAYIVLDRE
jgi:hypothetical protein